MVEGVNVPRRTESCHLANRFGGENGFLSELFSCVNVRQVNLDERQRGVEQGIQYRVTNLSERASVEDYTRRSR